jgi:hypothetical protein
MSRIDDLSRSFTAFEQDNTLIVDVEISLSSWLRHQGFGDDSGEP